jgi:hypothetical protein
MRQLAKLWLRIDWIIWFMIVINMEDYYPYFVTTYHCIGAKDVALWAMLLGTASSTEITRGSLRQYFFFDLRA